MSRVDNLRLRIQKSNDIAWIRPENGNVITNVRATLTTVYSGILTTLDIKITFLSNRKQNMAARNNTTVKANVNTFAVSVAPLNGFAARIAIVQDMTRSSAPQTKDAMLLTEIAYKTKVVPQKTATPTVAPTRMEHRFCVQEFLHRQPQHRWDPVQMHGHPHPHSLSPLIAARLRLRRRQQQLFDFSSRSLS